MCRALPGSEYYGGSAPSRTDRPTVDPARPAALDARRPGRTGTVPVFTVIRSTKEEPDSVPAASPRLPRSTSPWPPGRPSADPPRSSPPRPSRAGAHRARPRSARFEPVSRLRDVQRRFLAYSSPSRSPDPHHLAVLARPGFVRAAPTLPGTSRIRLPSASPPCCDRTAAKVSHLHSNQQRLTAHQIGHKRPRNRCLRGHPVEFREHGTHGMDAVTPISLLL